MTTFPIAMRPLLGGLLVALCACLYSIFWLQSTQKWWYEDDPVQYSAAAQVSNPIDIFLDPRTLRNFGTGASVVPMQVLSYWFDTKFFGVSPRAAYMHSLVSLVVVVLLLYTALALYTGKVAASAWIAVIWMFLPATVAVHFFLATRHYMEGLGWSLLAGIFLYLHINRPSQGARHLLVLAILVSTVLAMLSKEIYVATLSFVFLYSFFKRRYCLCIASIVLGVLYLAYRFWIVGLASHYPVDTLGVRSYLKYLAILPYTFAASASGYAAYLALFIGCVLLLLRRPVAESSKIILIVLATLASTLIATYPTAAAILITYKIPGTWYRSPFLLNTLVLLFVGYLFVRYLPPRSQLLGLLAAFAILVPGAQETVTHWTGRFARSEQEAKFYLSNPDKLLFSEEAAHWFIPGVGTLYNVPAPHYISSLFTDGPDAKAMLALYPTIWRYRDGHFVQDSALYQSLVGESHGAGGGLNR